MNFLVKKAISPSNFSRPPPTIAPLPAPLYSRFPPPLPPIPHPLPPIPHPLSPYPRPPPLPTPSLYADDSAILDADKNISTVENSLQTDLQIVSEWLFDNKLSLHLSKTESILFGSKSRLRPWSKMVSEYDQEIPQSQTADSPVAPQGRAAQPSRDTRKKNKQSNQLSLLHQDDCNTKIDIK